MNWTLLPVSAIYGLAAVAVFHRFSDRQSIRATVNRMMAHAMEFRLFIDSPGLILRAQRDLIRENFHLLRSMAVPCAILAAVFLILFPELNAMYGHAPLKANERSVVTAELRDFQTAAVILEAPAGIDVETPGVRSVHDGEISWRIRPLGRVAGELRIRNGNRAITERIVAGSGAVDGWRLPFTSPAIKIRYPRTTIAGANWMVWFFLISSAVTISYRR